MRSVWFALLSLGAWAQGITVPVIGVIADSSGDLRLVQGAAGNFWLGPPTTTGVLSAACSDRLCLAKTDSKILSATGETGAPPGTALFSISGTDAIVYFPSARTFARWHEDTLDPLDWSPEGEILSVRGTGIAVRRDGQTWVVHPDGAVVDWISDTPGPVLLLAESVLFATPGELVLRHPDASEVRIPLAGVESITSMGPHYAAIRVSAEAGGAIYALRIESGREALLRLPGSTP